MTESEQQMLAGLQRALAEAPRDALQALADDIARRLRAEPADAPDTGSPDALSRFVSQAYAAMQLETSASGELFRQFVDNLPQLAWIAEAGTQGQATWFNQAWLDFTGTTVEQNLGSGWKALHHPDHVDEVVRKFEHHVSEGLDWEDTFPLRAADGSYRWFLSRMKVIRDACGQVRIFGTNTDITSKKIFEGEIGEKNEFLEALVAQAPAAIAVWRGPDHRFEMANARYKTMVARTDLLGRTLREVFSTPEVDASGIFDAFESVFKSGESLEVPEYEVFLERHGVKESAFFAYTLAPLRENGVVTRLIAMAIEVTEQVLARRRVEVLQAAAESASRAKDEFLTVLSHELRTPLNAITGWASMLREGRVSAENLPKAIETIERNAKAQTRLIEDLLDLSRIEQGKLVLSVGPVEMVRVVEAALDTVRPAASAKGVRLQPVLDSHATIVGDGDRLQQVVWNLVSNAIKFTPKGGRVLVTLRRQPSFVELAVADTGQGISSELLPHVFDRFRQADASFTRKHGGLGLGLAIVRSLVELHGGTVTAESAGVGTGATFTVRLPMAPLRVEAGASKATEASDVPAVTFECPAVLAGKNVLVVDDERDTRELLRFVISQCDCAVSTAASAEGALRALTEASFDVLVSDIGMPEMDGLELIRRVRELPGLASSVSALALTAYARAEDRTRAIRSGFDAHLAKPIDPAELLAVLGALVTARQRRWE